MPFFYIGNDSEKDIRRCHESRGHQDAITITGVAVDGQIKDFTGIVQMIDHVPDRPAGKEWRIIIREIKPPTLKSKTASGRPAR